MIRNLSKYARGLALGAMTGLALLAGSAVNPAPAKAEPIAFILGATYIALGGGAICGTIDATTGNNVCQGRDNTEWATSFYKTTSYKYASVEGTPAFNVAAVTPAPAFTAKATNQAEERRAQLVAEFSGSRPTSLFAALR